MALVQAEAELNSSGLVIDPGDPTWEEPGPTAEAQLPAVRAPEPAEPAEAALPTWEWIVPAWIGTSLLWFGWMGWQMFRFQRLLYYGYPAPGPLQRQTEELAQRLGLRRRPNVWLVPGTLSPMVWGIGANPRLLFPRKLLERLDHAQRATLILHELAHLRRRD